MWPTRTEVANEGKFVDFVRPQKFTDLRVLNDALYPEIWGIICSFLFGFYETVQIMVPASAIFTTRKIQDGEADGYSVNFRQLYKLGIDRFCGPASQQPFQIEVYDSICKTVQGPCPFPLRAFTGSDWSNWISDQHGDKFAATEPMLIEIWRQEHVHRRHPMPMYSTWHLPPNLEFRSKRKMDSAMGQMTSLSKQSLFHVMHWCLYAYEEPEQQNTDDDNDGIDDEEHWDEDDEEEEEDNVDCEEEEWDDEDDDDDGEPPNRNKMKTT